MDLDSRILHRDANLLILDKPAGIPVHRGPSGRPSLEDALAPLAFGLRAPPVPAHRLDHDTSGCLALARHAKARSRLGRLFEAGRVRKLYWALVRPAPAAESGVIELALAKVSRPAGWRMQPDPAGQRAMTSWRVLGRAGDLAWLELAPETGRTHQIRVHLAAIGCPILGDPVYGRGDGPLMLHARRLEIPYWADRPPVVAEAPPPPAMAERLAAFTGA